MRNWLEGHGVGNNRLAADTVSRARALGLDPRRALADNDAYPFFSALGDLVRTGPTGTNVMDLTLVLVRP